MRTGIALGGLETTPPTRRWNATKPANGFLEGNGDFDREWRGWGGLFCLGNQKVKRLVGGLGVPDRMFRRRYFTSRII